MYPALSKRLAAIAQMVRPGRITADIGTDHGHLIVWLAATGRIPRGFACDVNPKPLENAVRACAAVPENKWLRASIWVVGGSLAIQVENSCEGVHPARRGWGYRDNEFLPAGAFSSSRAEGGMGLQSITLAAEKYDGDVGFRYSMAAKAFTTRVRLNLHPPGREP